MRMLILNSAPTVQHLRMVNLCGGFRVLLLIVMNSFTAVSECMERATQEMLDNGITAFGAVSSYGFDFKACANAPQKVIYFNKLVAQTSHGRCVREFSRAFICVANGKKRRIFSLNCHPLPLLRPSHTHPKSTRPIHTRKYTSCHSPFTGESG